MTTMRLLGWRDPTELEVGRGAGCQRTQPLKRGLQLSVPPMTSGKGEEPEISFRSLLAEDLIRHAYMMASP